MRDLRLRCVLMLFALLQAGWSGAGEQGWKAGVARTEITPPQGLWMAGYAARTRPAEGVLQPLWVKALALQAPGSDPAVVVTSDLLGFPRTLSGRVAAALRERFGLERSRVMLTSSHTHSGPVLSGALLDIYPMDEQQWGLVDGYSRQLETRIVETVRRGAGRHAARAAVFRRGPGVVRREPPQQQGRRRAVPAGPGRAAQRPCRSFRPRTRGPGRGRETRRHSLRLCLSRDHARPVRMERRLSRGRATGARVRAPRRRGPFSRRVRRRPEPDPAPLCGAVREVRQDAGGSRWTRFWGGA